MMIRWSWYQRTGRLIVSQVPIICDVAPLTVRFIVSQVPIICDVAPLTVAVPLRNEVTALYCHRYFCSGCFRLRTLCAQADVVREY